MLILTNPPMGEALYTDYTVKVNGIDASLSAVRVSAMPYNTAWPGYQRPTDQTELASTLSFSSDEPVTITITYKNEPNEVTVRPLSKKVLPYVFENTATITLKSAGFYTVEADGFHHALHIFFDPITDFEKSPANKTVIRYGAGIHKIGKVELFSDTTVIIDRDAVLYGSFIAIDAQNISILGYGTIDGSDEVRTSESSLLPLDYYAPISKDTSEFKSFLERDCVLDGILRFYRCKNVHIEGVTMRDSSTFALIMANCSDCVVENVKAIGMWKYNSDGIDLFNCRDVKISNSFFRCFDDCIVLKGICGWDELGMENIHIENCVTWCDWGRNLEIGAETNSPIYRNILFKDCDCIHGSTMFCDIHHHNRADIFDVTFYNINCEYTKHQLSDTYQHDMSAPFKVSQPTRHPVLINAAIYDMGLFSKDGLHGGISNVIFKNIKMLTDGDIPAPLVIIRGLDENHRVQNITINGIYRNNICLTSDSVELHTNEFSDNVSFI